MSLNINKGDSTKDYRTNFGKVCLNMVKKYSHIYPYYDDMMGSISMSAATYNSSSELQDEVYALLREPRFKDDQGCPNNWCMEVYEGYDPDTEDVEAEMLFVRTVESWQ